MRRKLFNFAAAVSLVVCAGIWLIGSFGNNVTGSGVLVWSSGHNELNRYSLTEVSRRWGFSRLRGFEAGHAANFVIAPHWVFLVLAFPAILWFALTVIGEAKRHQRWVGGRCISCGYSLTRNPSGICPECGTPIAGKVKAKA